MTILRTAGQALLATTVLATTALSASAEDYSIRVWAGGSSPADHYRVDAIAMAADILEREAAIRGEELTITVEGQSTFDGWDDFKQAVTLAAEAGDAPNIVVTSHADIAAWSQAGIIVPIEDYINLDAWPVTDIYDNLMDIVSFGGTVYGLPPRCGEPPLLLLERSSARHRLHRRTDRCSAGTGGRRHLHLTERD